MLEPRTIFPAFFIIWAGLGVLGLIYFHSDKSAAEKRRFFPRYVIGTGVVFGLIMFLSVPWPAALLFTPFIALVTWLNIRVTKFCDGCGKLAVNHAWWRKMKFCPYCGRDFPE